MIESADELRGKDGADRAGVDRVIGVTTHVLVHRADIHAGTATDALEGLTAYRVGKHICAAIIQQDEVELLGAITRGDACPE